MPLTYDEYKDLDGVDRKSTVISLMEGCGMNIGIATDMHVCKVSTALTLYHKPECLKQIYAEHVESSLREWIPQSKYKQVNHTMGAIAQILTQDVHHDNADAVGRLVASIGYGFTDEYKVELVFWIIMAVRGAYSKNSKAAKTDMDMEEDDTDEDEGAVLEAESALDAGSV